MYRKKFLKRCFAYLGLTAMYYVLGRATCGYSMSPFGFSVLLAVLFFRKKVLLNAVCFLIGNTFAGFNIASLFVSINMSCVVFLTSLLLKKTHKNLNKYLILVPLLLGLICFCYFNFGDIKQNLLLCFACVLCVIFTYSMICFGGAISRGYNASLNLDEKVCGSIFLIVFGMGLSNINIAFFEFSKFVGVYAILCSTMVFPQTTFLIAGLLGLGSAINSTNILYIAVFVGYGLAGLGFKTNYKIFSVVAVVLTEIVVGLYFKAYDYFTWFSLISVGGAGLTFLCTPKSVFQKLKDVLGCRKENLAVRGLVNRTKSGICKRMNELAQVFDEMNVVYRGMIKGVLPENESKMMLVCELQSKVCASCPERHNCNRNNNIKDVYDMLVECGFERGRVNLLDVPQYFVNKCGRINFLITTLNQTLKSYRNYTQLVSNMDASRVLIADQLLGVKEMLQKLSNEVRLNITFDVEKENMILEELSYKNVVCYEAVVYEEHSTSQNVSLVLRRGAIDNAVLEKAVSKVCKVKMMVCSVDNNQIPNVTLVTLKNKGNYDIAFGCSSISKNGVMKNGDAHSVVKLDNGRYMVALCDGVGSGEKAHRISNLSITLIENFYKAGFENDTILNSINKLLSLNNDENFSSVDLCVLDFNNNLSDFIKLGATYGFVKNKNKTEVIESSGLPIGVLEEMRPHITKKVIEPFDTIILISDGISDAFDTKEDLRDFIDNITTTNPQTISEEILDRAVDLNNGKIKDDMTVLVVRVFPV